MELDHFPARLLRETPSRTQSSRVVKYVGELVATYLAGSPARLVEAFTEAGTRVAMRTPFEQNLMLTDLVTLEEFFRRGPSGSPVASGTSHRRLVDLARSAG